MGCSASSQSARDQGMPDDNALYGYDLYGDDDRRGSVEAGEGRWRTKDQGLSRELQARERLHQGDSGDSGYTETEHSQQQPFHGRWKEKKKTEDRETENKTTDRKVDYTEEETKEMDEAEGINRMVIDSIRNQHKNSSDLEKEKRADDNSDKEEKTTYYEEMRPDIKTDKEKRETDQLEKDTKSDSNTDKEKGKTDETEKGRRTDDIENRKRDEKGEEKIEVKADNAYEIKLESSSEVVEDQQVDHDNDVIAVHTNLNEDNVVSDGTADLDSENNIRTDKEVEDTALLSSYTEETHWHDTLEQEFDEYSSDKDVNMRALVDASEGDDEIQERRINAVERKELPPSSLPEGNQYEVLAPNLAKVKAGAAVMAEEEPTDSHRAADEGETMAKENVEVYDFRSRPDDDLWDDDLRPSLPPGQLWTDPEFGLYDAIKDRATNKKLSWKRPTELSPNPVLFSDGTTRFDIGQGSAGTCYFLSTVANISQDENILKKAIPDDAYPVGTPDYQGIFHARFWSFGKWVDVYIDDYLPVIHDNQLWGAKSATNENEFWVSLLEKAFARHHGSYNSVYGGQPGEAFSTLTGGVAERLDFKDDDTKPAKLFERVRNAVQSGAFVTCSVPEEYDNVHGLIGGHAYSLTGAAKAKGTCLLRVRNPWGNTEWNGAWSDESSEWQGVSNSEVPRAKIDDGEFWISLDDFMRYFSQTTICSLTPDFDMDGDSDPLENVANIYGEWKGQTAAGFDNKLKNPRYLFTVPDSYPEAQVVVQLIQHKKKRQDDGVQMRCDLYRVLGDNGKRAVMEMMGDSTNSYSPETQSSFRHVVTSGTYAVVPSTADPGLEKTFLIKLFSSCPLADIRELPPKYKTTSAEQQATVSYNGKVYQLTHCQTMYGAWSNEAGNAGGQVSHRESHATNPQYNFVVKTHTMIVLHVLQDKEEPQYAAGFRLYPGGEAPLDIEEIFSKYESAVEDVEGDQYKFVQGWDVHATYLLKPGQYTLLLHLDDPGQEKNYAMVVKSSAPVHVQGFQTGT